MAKMNSRHWAVIGLSTMGVAAMFSQQSEGVILAIVTGIGGIFAWDKIEKYTSAGAEKGKANGGTA